MLHDFQILGESLTMHWLPRFHRGIAAGLSALLLALPCAAQSQTRSGVTLDVSPNTREQTIAFYTARGFSATAIAPYAQACVLSFSFRNDSRTALRFRLADWRAEDGTRFRPVTEWETLWNNSGIPQAARIAFRWAQFPPDQEFEAGDWIMGMAALERRIAGPFRVIARYTDDKGEHELVSNTVSCGD